MCSRLLAPLQTLQVYHGLKHARRDAAKKKGTARGLIGKKGTELAAAAAAVGDGNGGSGRGRATTGLVYYTDAKAIHNGVYINNPHYLVRFDVTAAVTAAAAAKAVALPPKDDADGDGGSGVDKGGGAPAPVDVIAVPDDDGFVNFTVILSQYQKKRDILYSVQAMSTASLQMRRLRSGVGDTSTTSSSSSAAAAAAASVSHAHAGAHTVVATGAWSGDSAGGCGNHKSFSQNPTYALHLRHSMRALLSLAAPKAFAVGLAVYDTKGVRLQVCRARKLSCNATLRFAHERTMTFHLIDIHSTTYVLLTDARLSLFSIHSTTCVFADEYATAPDAVGDDVALPQRLLHGRFR
jgi:hypothetical protein